MIPLHPNFWLSFYVAAMHTAVAAIPERRHVES